MMHQKKIDIDRCRKAMMNLEITGFVRTYECTQVINSVLAEIKENPATALEQEYRCITRSVYTDHGGEKSYLAVAKAPYNFRPEQGEVVFSVKKKKHYDKKDNAGLGDDEIYLLESFTAYGIAQQLNLCEAIDWLRRLEMAADDVRASIEYTSPDSLRTIKIDTVR